MGSADRGSVVLLINEKYPKLRDTIYYSGKKLHRLILFSLAPGFLEGVVTPNTSTSDTQSPIYVGRRTYISFSVSTYTDKSLFLNYYYSQARNAEGLEKIGGY